MYMRKLMFVFATLMLGGFGAHLLAQAAPPGSPTTSLINAVDENGVQVGYAQVVQPKLITFTFTGSYGDAGANSVNFQCALDTSSFQSCSSPQTYSFSMEANHTFTVRAVHGNTVDSNPPSFIWYTGPDSDSDWTLDVADRCPTVFGLRTYAGCPTVLVPASFAAVGASNEESFGIKGDGSVWAWGDDGNGVFSGKLGVGTTAYVYVPVPAPVGGIANVVTLVSGQDGHTVAIKADGTVWSWGMNMWGGLGDGTTVNHMAPTQLIGLVGTITQVAAGYGFSLALKSDGDVWGLGVDTNGQVRRG